MNFSIFLKNIKKFGKYKGRTIGYKGVLKKSLSTKNIARILNKKLKTNCKVLDFGKSKIKSIGIVSGGGSVYHDYDGEITYSVIVRKRDLKTSDIFDIYRIICYGLIEAIKILGAKCTSGIEMGKMGECIIHPVKPLNCRTYSCKNNLGEYWFLWIHIAKGNPDAEKEFFEFYERKRFSY